MPKARISLLNALGGGPLVVMTEEKKGGKIVKKTVTVSNAEKVNFTISFSLVILELLIGFLDAG